jgi:hypothetical protein
MKTPISHLQSPPSRPALVAILDQFNISTASFDRLRSDSYEKHIAARSLAELEGLYRTLLAPSGSYEEKQKLCPVWNKGGKGEDKLPDITTLSRIKHRIMAEHMAVDLGQHVEMMNSILSRLPGLPADLKKDVYDLMMAVLGNELFKSKFDGKQLMENLPVVKCIMKDKELKMRERESTEQVELQKISKELQSKRLELEAKKLAQRQQEAEFRRSTIGGTSSGADHRPSPHQTPPNESSKEEEDSGLTEDEKSARLLKKAFGITLTSHQRKFPALRDSQAKPADTAVCPTPGVAPEVAKMN